MGEIEHSGLLDANMVFKNKDGEIVFSMKRKDNYDSLYYIFEKKEENMTAEEIPEFEKAFKVIVSGARMFGIPIYDSEELFDGVSGMTQVVLRSKEALRAVEKANKTGKVTLVKDVDIKVFDHATGKIGTLTVGISVPPGSEDYIKELRKTHNVPDFI